MREKLRRMNPRRRWTIFTLWAAVVLAAAPYANDIQSWISDRLGSGALRIAVMGLLVGVTGAVAARLFARRASLKVGQLIWLVGLAALATSLIWRLDVDAEPVHLALYAILGSLAFWALSAHHGNRGVYPAAAALTALVGTVDETLQWLLPTRFWDLGDVGINVAAGVMVQLVIWQVVRPASILPVFEARSLRLAARLAIGEALLLLFCVSNTPARIDAYVSRVPGLSYLGQGLSTIMNDYGHLHEDPEIGRFRSRMTREQLLAHDQQHGAEVAQILDQIGTVGRLELQEIHSLAREPFIYEAIGHLELRRRLSRRARMREAPAEQQRLATIAFREHLILERYFPRSLELSKSALKHGQRHWLESRNRPEDDFESRESDWLLTAFSEGQAQMFLLALLIGLIVAERACSRRLLSKS